MSYSGYKLICTDGETEGDSVAVRSADLPTVARFLRASLNWTLSSAAGEVNYSPDQLVFVEYSDSMEEMLDRDVFKTKHQARSSWSLVEDVA